MAKIDCIRVNADYEMVLFHGKSGPALMREALEFLAFYLQDLPVLTSKEYSQEFLTHVEKLSGRIPQKVSQGQAQNWWGPLTDLNRERWLNSKFTSFKLALEHGWTEGNVFSREEIQAFHVERETLIKDPHGMSGKGLITLRPGVPVHVPQSMQGELIAEPLLDRKYDFSRFNFPDGTSICYQNLVDEKFQYRGTLFSSPDNFSESSLDFYQEVSSDEWQKYKEAMAIISQHYGETPYGYSVDSFIYEVNGEKKIHILSEVNARRTMGLMAYEMMKMMGKGKKTALSLKKPFFEDHILLSPAGSLFEIYLSFG
ncbi:MAG: hypothetical protein V4598_17925 [Bdellovibrionota bacterium]